MPRGSTAVAYFDSASSRARRVSTRARCSRNSALAFVSLMGCVPSAACSAAAATLSAVAGAPANAASTPVALIAIEPMFVNATDALEMVPSSRFTSAATPTMAQSIARRWNFW